MAKLYIEDSKHLEILKPTEETVDFILDYSQALSIMEYNNLKFEALLN